MVTKKLKYDNKRKLQNKPDLKNFVIWKCNFLNDTCNRKLTALVKKYDLPIKLVNKHGRYLKQCINQPVNRDNKHQNCDICDKLPDQQSCSDKFTVYKFTCILCHKFYIGQTARPFYQRYNNKRCLVTNNNNSALSDHARHEHENSLTIHHFTIEFLNKFQSPVEARIAEAKYIQQQCPSLNRREELTQW